MTHGSIFTGIGGFELGFEEAGFKSVWQCEKDKHCLKLLERRFPDTIRFDNVMTMRGEDAEQVDVITFGSPCQDLSLAGQRKGMAGERSGLFFEAIRVIGERRPSFAVWENVPGALSSNNGRDFYEVLNAFRGVGAIDVCWRILDAQHWGVAQRRRRLFIVADFRGERAGEILFESESVSRVTQTLSSGTFFCWDTGVRSLDRASKNNVIIENGIARFATPVEVERSFGFQDQWTEGFADSVRYRMLGNAVCVNVARWIAERIARVL